MLLVSLFLASSAFAQELAPQYKLMDEVRQMVKQGKSLDEIKKELKIAGPRGGGEVSRAGIG